MVAVFQNNFAPGRSSEMASVVAEVFFIVVVVEDKE